MIAFNHNLIFKHELSLNDESFNDTLETIFICEVGSRVYEEIVIADNTWDEVSSQLVRYFRLDIENTSHTLFSWGMEIKDLLTLIWDTDERVVFYKKSKNYTSQKLQFWVLHTFFPMVLEFENKYRILHVGGVEIEGKSVLFSAFSYGGKSTLTDYFIQKGHCLLSDDTVAIESRDDTYYAISSYPFHRPFRKSETLGYAVENFSNIPKPVHAVYVLEKAEHNTMVEIKELIGIEKFRAFYYTAFIVFDFTKKERFVFFSDMARKVAVYKISIPWDMERLPEVYEAICTHQQKI